MVLLEHLKWILEEAQQILAHKEALLENLEYLFEQSSIILEDQTFIRRFQNILEHSAHLLENPRKVQKRNKIQTLQTLIFSCLTFTKFVDLLNNQAYTDNSELQNLTRASR